MDVVRKHSKRNRNLRRAGVFIAIVVAGVFVSVALGRLEPAAPTVSRDSVMIDTVKRGTMQRKVGAPGTLIPVDIRWITASTHGRIASLPLKPGTAVETDMVILELVNPELNKDAEDAKWALASAEAELKAAREKLDNQLLELQGSVEDIRGSLDEAELQWEADQQLYKETLISGQKHQLSKKRCEQLRLRVKNAESRTQNFQNSIDPQLDVQQAKVSQAKAQHQLKIQQVADLTIRAGQRGILQQLGAVSPSVGNSRGTPLAVGQWLTAGTPLAMITDPQNLQAELRVSEVQARDILLGQSVEIDARVAKIAGKITRIDPASSQGTVAVDVELEGELPQGARPDLSVNGTILIERLEDVLHTRRIRYGEPGSKLSVFKLDVDGEHAQRVAVELGRSSVLTIEIVDGLEVGDQIIISDTKRWEDHDRIRLQ